MAGNSEHQNRDKWKDTVNNLKSKFSTPQLSIFNENLVNATEALSLSLPIGANTDKLRSRVKSFGSDIRRLRSKSCERVFQRCRKGFEKVVKKEQQQEDYFSQSTTLRQSRRCRTKKAKPSQKTYNQYARALVDVTPSPYDCEALSLRVGDLIGVISQHPSGIWMGECEGKIGRFKFINVELVEYSEETVGTDKDTVTTLSDLLQKLELSHLSSKLELNGYDNLDCLESITRKDLEYLGVRNLSEQDKLIQAGASIRNGDIKIEKMPEDRLDSGYFDCEPNLYQHNLDTEESRMSNSSKSSEELETESDWKSQIVEKRNLAINRRSKHQSSLSAGEVWSCYRTDDVVF